MADFVAVLPVVWRPYGVDCLATMHPALASRTLVVDNTEVNRGVPWSWNAGIDYMTSEGADWLVILSAAVRFGDAGGRDFIAELDAHDLRVMEAKYVGWQCIAFHREVFEKAGRFDENFYPGYFEDLDFGWRVTCAYGLAPPFWDKRPFDLKSAGWSHSSQLAGIVCDADRLMGYLHRKWGSVPGRGPTWDHPYNCPELPVSFQPPSLEWRGPGC